MPFTDLHEGVLEIFAEHAQRAHRTEWEVWANLEDRKRRSIESEVLGLKQLDAELRSDLLSPESVRGLSTDELRARIENFSTTRREREEQRRRERAKKVASNARASRQSYIRTVSDPEKYPKHLATKRQRRWAKRHTGQQELA